MLILQKLTSLFLFAALLSGCAIRPLPGHYIAQDYNAEVPKIDTVDIVSHIRCEARHAIALVTTGYIREYKIDAISPKINFEEIVKWYQPNRETKFNVPPTVFSKLNAKQAGALKDFLSYLAGFAETEVGFGFKFDTQETNNATEGKLSFKLPSGLGNVGLDLGGSYERERKNIREFAFSESIGDIATDDGISNEKCGVNFNGRSQETHLPMQGKIGLYDTFRTYAYLVLEARLGPSGGPKLSPVFKEKQKVDTEDLKETITFTTSISGNAHPVLTLDSNIMDGKLTMASAKATNSRTAVHELLLVLVPVADGSESQSVNIFKRISDTKAKNEGRLVTFSQ